MKDKVLMFIIGGLVGSIISAGAFYLYINNFKSNNCTNTNTQIPGGNPPNMDGQPPERPSNDNGIRPEMPSNMNR